MSGAISAANKPPKPPPIGREADREVPSRGSRSARKPTSAVCFLPGTPRRLHHHFPLAMANIVDNFTLLVITS